MGAESSLQWVRGQITGDCVSFFDKNSNVFTRLVSLESQQLPPPPAKKRRTTAPLPPPVMDYVGYQQFVDDVFRILWNADIDNECKGG